MTNKKIDTLKQAMKELADTKSNFYFLINDSHRATGFIPLRDIIIQFAPPCRESSLHGSSFFEAALKQTRRQVRNGTIVGNL